MRFEKHDITLRGSERETIVAARVHNWIAYHKALLPPKTLSTSAHVYSITHVPTGWRIGQARTLKLARRLAIAFYRHVPQLAQIADPNDRIALAPLAARARKLQFATYATDHYNKRRIVT